MSTGKISATRPGRLASSTTRSPSRTASRTLCVTNRTVLRRLAPDDLQLVVQAVARSSRRARRTARPSAGLRRPGRARTASATRWRIPPDSSCGRFVGEIAEVHHLEQVVRARARVRRDGTSASFKASSTLPRAVSHGNSAASWNIKPVCAALHVHRPRRRSVEPGDDVQQRALAAPGRAEQAHELAGHHVEADVIECGHGRGATVAEHLR